MKDWTSLLLFIVAQALMMSILYVTKVHPTVILYVLGLEVVITAFHYHSLRR